MLSWIAGIMETAGYPGIVFLMFVENVFPPIPSEIIMPMAGYNVRKGKLSFILAALCGAIGSTLGALPLYFLGAKVGAKRLNGWADKYGWFLGISSEELKKATQRFSQNQGRSVLLARLVPGVRSLISIPAGINRMPLPQFLLFTFLGTGLWSLFLLLLGVLLGPSFIAVDKFLGPLSWIILGGIVIWLGVRAWKKRK